MMKHFIVSIVLTLGLTAPAVALPELRADTYSRDHGTFTPNERAAIFGHYEWYSDVPSHKTKRDLHRDSYSPYTDDFERTRVSHGGKEPRAYRDALARHAPAGIKAGDVLRNLSSAGKPPKALKRQLNDRTHTEIVLFGSHLVLIERDSGRVLDVIAHVVR